MPKARQRRATSPPMRPAPISPSVRPRSSAPLKRDRAHSPLRTEASAAATPRTMERISAIVSSAAETVFPAGALRTAIPLSVAASRSMLSTPTPARPTTRRAGACASISALTFVALRTMSPCAVFSASANPPSDESSICTISNRSSARMGSSPAAETLSVTSTVKGRLIAGPRRALREEARRRPESSPPCVRCETLLLSSFRIRRR